MLVQGYCII